MQDTNQTEQAEQPNQAGQVKTENIAVQAGAERKRQNLFLYITPQHLDILRNARLHLRAINDFLDPFEQNIRPLKSQELRISDIELESELKKQFANLPDGVASLMDWEHFKQETLKKREKIEAQMLKKRQGKEAKMPSTEPYKKLMRLSLHKRGDNPVLWQRLAGNHTGIVLELDLRHKSFAKHKKMVKPINYSGSRPKEVAGAIVPALFSKAPEFASEQEVLLVMSQTSATANADFKGTKVYFLNFHPDAIVNIILGANISEDTKKQLDNIMKYDMKYKPGKPLKQAFLDKNTYKIHLNPTL